MTKATRRTRSKISENTPISVTNNELVSVWKTDVSRGDRVIYRMVIKTSGGLIKEIVEDDKVEIEKLFDFWYGMFVRIDF